LCCYSKNNIIVMIYEGRYTCSSQHITAHLQEIGLCHHH